MTPQLRAKIQSLASEFASGFAEGLVNLLNDMPLSALTGASETSSEPVRRVAAPRKAASSKGGRLNKRSSEEIDAMIVDVVAALKDEPEGLSSEKLQKKMGVSKKEIQRPLILALERSDVRKSGEKRGTLYFIPNVIRKAYRPSRSAPLPKVKAKAASKKAAPKKAKAKVKAAAKPKAAKPRPSKKHKVHVEVVDHSKTNSAPAAAAST